MQNEMGRFLFLNTWDYLQMRIASSDGTGQKVYHDGDTTWDYLLDDKGGRTNLVVSDGQPKGSGLQEEPTKQTVKFFKRHADFCGNKLPWL